MRCMTNPARIKQWTLLASLFVLVGLAIVAGADWYSALPKTARATFVGRDSCAQCHATQAQQWHGSDHDRAMEIASAESVLGDFNDTSFERLGVTTRFFRQGGKYFVHTEGPDGEYNDFEIKYTFGVRPLQQYMVEFPDGRVQVLRVSWDTRKNEWFYVTPPDVPDERIEPGDPLHWTGIGQNWNTMCAECHSTDLHKNFDIETNTYHTTYKEIDVSCETCHGPASLHVELAESNSWFWDRHRGYGLPELKGADTKTQLETCAPCHSRRAAIHADYRAGDNFLDYYNPALLDPGLYHPDGQILDEVYVYGSFLQSKMYHEGVKCTDCHNPHSLELKFEGNRLCAQCHQPGKYDSPTHHHHTDPAATQCVNCHMPSQTYMVVDDRRDHSLRIPRPDLSEQLGSPNACNNCHVKPKESPAWAAAAVREWYGEKRPDDPHYGVAFDAARRSDPEGLELLAKLLGRRKTPDIVRATAVELLANYRAPEVEKLARQQLDHSSPLVRAAALRVLPHSSVASLAMQVADKLKDPVRLVRLAAAQRLVGQAAQLLGAPYRALLEEAVAEFRQAQQIMLERAGTHLNLAALEQALGNTAAVEQSLETAIKLEPYLSGVRDQLATLKSQAGGDADEIRALREQEIELLARDSKLLDTSAAPRYRRGMLLYLLQRYDEARAEFVEATTLEPNSYESWMALALICEKQQRWQQAVDALKKMNELRPNDPAVRGIFQRIQQSAADVDVDVDATQD